MTTDTVAINTAILRLVTLKLKHFSACLKKYTGPERSDKVRFKLSGRENKE
jgi:hypothetical protein